jgi:DNA-binding LacI/PurR family transcriptional regulator
VTFGRPWGEQRPRHHWVDVDGAAGTQAAVEHLIERGHRRIGFLGWPPGSGVGDDRHAGWARALTAHRLPQRGLAVRGEDGEDTGAALASRLLQTGYPPTALVCASDSLALGALRAIQQRGREPGHDIAVTGFDDTPIAAALTPGLTSVRQPVEAAATAIVRMLADRMAGTPAPPASELITPQLIVRASSSPTPTEP